MTRDLDAAEKTGLPSNTGSIPGGFTQLLQPDSRRGRIKWLFLIMGLGLAGTSISLLLGGVDLGVTITMGSSAFNFSPIIYLIMLFLGFFLATKFFSLAPYRLRENAITRMRVDQYREQIEQQATFFSSSHSREATALLFLAIGIMDLVVLTPFIGNPGQEFLGLTYAGTGTAVVLGGVSFFYPAGLPLFMMGIGLALYLVFSRFFGRIARSENLFYFHEFRFGVPWLTELPRSHVEAVRYQNTHLGPKVIWAIICVPFAIIVLQYAIPLYNQPRAEADTLPIMLTLSAVGALLGLVLLLFWPQDYFEIASKDRFYEMWLAPTTNAFEVRDQIAELFGFSVPVHPKRRSQRDGSGMESSNNPQFSQELLHGVNPTQRDFTQVLLGTLLLAISILSAFSSIFFGILFWTGAAIYGTFLIARGTLSDFSNRDGTQVTVSPGSSGNSAFHYTRRFFRKFQLVFFPATTRVTVSDRPHKLEVIDVVAIAWVFAFGTYQTILGWIIADLAVPLLLWETIGTTLIFGILVLLVFAFFVIPRDHIVVNSATILYAIPVSPVGTTWGALRHLRTRTKNAWQDKASRKPLLIRGIVILSIALIAAIMAIIGPFT